MFHISYLGEGVGGGALFAPEALQSRPTATDSSHNFLWPSSLSLKSNTLLLLFPVSKVGELGQLICYVDLSINCK